MTIWFTVVGYVQLGQLLLDLLLSRAKNIWSGTAVPIKGIPPLISYSEHLLLFSMKSYYRS
jgi:hypothetical protein